MRTMESSSLNKMLGILSLFSEDKPQLEVEEVVTLLACSRATAYRYLKALADAGLIAGSPRGEFVLGPRVIEFDRLLRKHDPLLCTARPVIERVSHRMQSNVMLCSYYGDKVMCVDRVWPDSSVVSSYERGRPMPMFLGATAKSILANLSPHQQRNVFLNHESEIRAAGLGEDWPGFRGKLRQWRRDGVYVSHGEVDPGRIGIGAPIFASARRVVGSFVFITAARGMSQDRIDALARVAKEAAAEISAGLE